MSRLDLYNAALLLIASSAGVAGAAQLAPKDEAIRQLAPRSHAIGATTLADGRRALRDASDTVVELRNYRRILSLSLIADHVLWELCESERIVGVTVRTKESPHFGHRHGERAGITKLSDLEGILALKPDLILVNHLGDPRHAARLRERGIAVFDLGDMQGLSTLLPTIDTIATLIGRPEAGPPMGARLRRRLQAVAAGLGERRRPRGLYLSVYGKEIFGGTKNTSFHDVLHYGGIEDAAAADYEGWPALGSEQILALDPDLIVTKQGMGRTLCQHPGLERLRACGPQGRIVELDPGLIDDPGPPMLEVAETLFERVYGPTAPPSH
ncbi:MAG: ABC transporter substrate-binding protein [Myxococcales bacterium]|nr:ABC transporter substrate-binding protein [Myxococcales bacterium]